MSQLWKIKSLWGMTGSLERQIEQIAEAGYDGVEAALVFMDERDSLPALLERHKLGLVAQILTRGHDAAEHAADFREQMGHAASYGAMLAVVHGGKDRFPFDEQKRFFEAALACEAQLGLPAGHETHRGRPMFTPWTTAALLREFPELKLTADISHWVCVCESYLEDHAEELLLAARRTIHIHARVGYPEGPQVPHPAAPEYARELEVHEAFWETVCRLKREENASLSFTPEFGPPSYLHTLPFTSQPVADLWDVCEWMASRFTTRFAAYFRP